MDTFYVRCKECGLVTTENKIIITVNQYGEWVLHCPKCNSELLELTNELTKKKEYDNEK